MKTHTSIILLFALFFVNWSSAAEGITVLETTFESSYYEDKEFLFGFAEGDQIVFTLQVLKGRPINEFEVSEYEGPVRFSDVKIWQIVDKSVKVTSTGIYKFRIRGARGTKRCKLLISRIPARSESNPFNTTVYWRSKNDTSFYTIKERYLASKDTVSVNVIDRVEKVHSSLNLNGNKNTFNFTLPANTSTWSYYIGVDQAGQDHYNKATRDLAKYAAPVVARIPGYGPLAALALGGASYLTKLQSGEDIDFYLVENGEQRKYSNGDPFFYLKKGKVVNDFAQMPYRSGILHFCLENDNAVTGVQVTIKVVAVTITENWEEREVQKFHVADRDEPYLKN